jgi:hypothetical protein
MAEESRTRRLAILIDADNTSPRIAAGLFEEVAKFGEASVRRIYGDALAVIGRRDEARVLFIDLLAHRNAFGLLSEDIHPEARALWGNIPQTYSTA